MFCNVGMRRKVIFLFLMIVCKMFTRLVATRWCIIQLLKVDITGKCENKYRGACLFFLYTQRRKQQSKVGWGIQELPCLCVYLFICCTIHDLLWCELLFTVLKILNETWHTSTPQGVGVHDVFFTRIGPGLYLGLYQDPNCIGSFKSCFSTFNIFEETYNQQKVQARKAMHSFIFAGKSYAPLNSLLRKCTKIDAP